MSNMNIQDWLYTAVCERFERMDDETEKHEKIEYYDRVTDISKSDTHDSGWDAVTLKEECREMLEDFIQCKTFVEAVFNSVDWIALRRQIDDSLVDEVQDLKLNLEEDTAHDIDYTKEYDEYVKYYEPHETLLPGVMSIPMTYAQFVSKKKIENMHMYYDDYQSYARDRNKKYLTPVSYEEYVNRREQYAEDKKNQTLASC